MNNNIKVDLSRVSRNYNDLKSRLRSSLRKVIFRCLVISMISLLSTITLAEEKIIRPLSNASSPKASQNRNSMKCSETVTLNKSLLSSVILRGGLPCLAKKGLFSSDLRIAFFGGGLMTNYDFRNKLTDEITSCFPTARVSNYAVMADSGELAAWRFESDLLCHEPDLIVVDLAQKNFDQKPKVIGQIAEAIVRKAWQQDPSTEFLFVYPIFKGTEKYYQSEQQPVVVQELERIAEYYGIPSIDFTTAVIKENILLNEKSSFAVDKIQQSKENVMRLFKKYLSKDGTNPTLAGTNFYQKTFGIALREMISPKVSDDPSARSTNYDHYEGLLKNPIASGLENAKMITLADSMRLGNWINEMRIESSSRSSYSRTSIPVWASSTVGDKISFRFKGSSVGIYEVVGNDTAAIRVIIDGQQEKARTFERKNIKAVLHYPAGLFFVRDLDSEKEHSVVIEIVSPGTVRIARIFINGDLR